MKTTETKHTPGPWRYVSEVPEWCRVSMGNGIVAELCGGQSEECEANARLIASAPELLAELRRGVALAVAAIRAMPATTEPNAVELAMWAGNGGPARAAIAKATAVSN